MTGYYYTLPATIFYDKKISANAKLLACLVANFCDRYGKCLVSNKYLGEVLSRSESTVSRLVSELVDAGYFNSIVDQNDSNKRTLTLSAKMLIPIRKNEDTYTQKCEDNNTKYNTIKSNIVNDVVLYLNEKTGKRYRPNNSNTKRNISARESEGYKLEDFKSVIDTMVKRWKGSEWEQYLTPQTLFSASKFEKYLNFAEVDNKTQKPNKIVI